MQLNSPVSDLIKKRSSCRTYTKTILSPEDLKSLENFCQSARIGPLGNQIRFQITAATANDSQALRGLGTYGFIQDPAGFIIGASQDQPGSLEDFGYLGELIILKATELGIGTCWLGGTFTKSRFSRILDLQPGEDLPSAISIGYPADQRAWIDRTTRILAGADRRLPWSDLFFENSFKNPLQPENSAGYSEPLEMVRLAPSASNKQPWRILKLGPIWHFYLHRTRKYPPAAFKLLINAADLQRIDLGIAMAHFELSAAQNHLPGNWVRSDPGLVLPDSVLEYVTSWKPA